MSDRYCSIHVSCRSIRSYGGGCICVCSYVIDVPSLLMQTGCFVCLSCFGPSDGNSPATPTNERTNERTYRRHIEKLKTVRFNWKSRVYTIMAQASSISERKMKSFSNKDSRKLQSRLLSATSRSSTKPVSSPSPYTSSTFCSAS